METQKSFFTTRCSELKEDQNKNIYPKRLRIRILHGLRLVFVVIPCAVFWCKQHKISDYMCDHPTDPIFFSTHLNFFRIYVSLLTERHSYWWKRNNSTLTKQNRWLQDSHSLFPYWHYSIITAKMILLGYSRKMTILIWSNRHQN